MRPQEVLPRRAGGGDFFLELLLGAVADRCEFELSLDVLFQRCRLFSADDDAGDGLTGVQSVLSLSLQ